MNKEVILNEVKNVLQGILNLEPYQMDEVNMETNVRDDLGADSLDAIELVMGIENRFGISVSDDAIEYNTKISEMVDYIYNKLEV